MFEIGLWAEAIGDEAPLRSEESVAKLIENARVMGVQHLYLQVFREGKSWWRPLERCASEREVFQEARNETLEFCLKRAAEFGISVHAWLNVFQLSSNFDSQICASLRSEAVIQDNFGWAPRPEGYEVACHSSGQFHMDSPGCWIDPASIGYRHYFVEVVEDLLAQFPKLSGVHLDYIRYPYYVPIRPSSAVGVGADFGYGERARERFLQESGYDESAFRKGDHGELLLSGYSVSRRWDEWRRSQVTHLLKEVSSRCNSVRISTAVVCWSDRAYLSAFQNWRAWLSNRDIDHIALMSYTADDQLFRQLVQQSIAFQSEESRVLAGVGGYLLGGMEGIQRQIAIAKDAGAAGAVLFSYRNLLREKVSLIPLL